MTKYLKDAIEDSPIIAAIKDDAGLEKVKDCDSRIVFILYGDLLSIPNIVGKVKAAGKIAFVHMDLVSGLQSKDISVDFIKEHTQADGIISTKASLISRAKDLSLYTVMRFFMLDSMAYDNIERQLKVSRPDIIEVLPGPMPKVVHKIVSMAKCPVIAGGLVADKEDVMSLLSAGAACISSTNTNIWFL